MRPELSLLQSLNAHTLVEQGFFVENLALCGSLPIFSLPTAYVRGTPGSRGRSEGILGGCVLGVLQTPPPDRASEKKPAGTKDAAS